MKNFYTLVASLLLSLNMFAQAPQGMSYQAVVRDANQALVTNQTVSTRISILQGTPTGPLMYIESHSTQSNINGLVTLIVGEGTVIGGDFSTIDWANGPYYIKTETDPTGGINYSIVGTTRMMSVPYALYAENGNPGPPGQDGVDGAQGPAGPIGPPGGEGASAYQIWLNLGNQGSTQDFINSLEGAQGPEGPGAYDEWLALGNTGSVQDFLNSLQGAPGPQGPQGPQGLVGPQGPVGPAGSAGASAYDEWLALGNSGTTQDFLNTLQGAQGPQGAVGPQGPIGPAGAQGTEGESAYDIWLAQGNTGSEDDFIDDLQGPGGAQGPAGPQGAVGPQGPVGATGAQGPAGVGGPDGESAYELWLGLGNSGTETDFINSLQGAQGLTGPQGPVGATGATGPQGPAGTNGANGANGESAFELWLALGNSGTETDFINSLQGATGATGPQGPAGTNGTDGVDGADGLLPNGTTAGDQPIWNGTDWVVNESPDFGSYKVSATGTYTNLTVTTTAPATDYERGITTTSTNTAVVLNAGSLYKINATLNASNFNDTEAHGFAFYDVTNNNVVSNTIFWGNPSGGGTSVANHTTQPITLMIRPTTNITLELRQVSMTPPTATQPTVVGSVIVEEVR